MLPAGKTIRQILEHEESLQEAALNMNVSVEKAREILGRTILQKEATEKATHDKQNAPPVESLSEHDFRLGKNILTAINELNFFAFTQSAQRTADESKGEIPRSSDSYETLEERAFGLLNKIEDERDPKKQEKIRRSAIHYFQESVKAWASDRATQLIRDGMSKERALETTVQELFTRGRGDNIRERSEAVNDVARMASNTTHHTEMYEALESMRQGYASGTPSAEDKDLMRRLLRAAKGMYLRGNSGDVASRYALPKMDYKFMYKLGSAYQKMVKDNLSQNNGALGSLEKFDLDLPNSYNNDGRPRSRPRRSSIPEERY